jgi:hypothetical protein
MAQKCCPHQFITQLLKFIRIKAIGKKLLVCVILFLTADAYALENPSFEAEDCLSSWHSVVFKQSQEPSITADPNNAKEGRQSLLSESTACKFSVCTQHVMRKKESGGKVTF